MQMENGEDRLEAYAETEERLSDCFCAIHKAAIIPNSCLDEELVCELVRSVYAMPKYKEYKQQQCRNAGMRLSLQMMLKCEPWIMSRTICVNVLIKAATT